MQQHSVADDTLLGWLFECAVKSGFVNSLLYRARKSNEWQAAQELIEQSSFKNAKFSELSRQAMNFLGISSHTAYKVQFLSRADYSRSVGYAQGQMLARIVLGRVKKSNNIGQIKRLYCPLPSMPTDEPASAADRYATIDAVRRALGLSCDPPSSGRGRLPNADFLVSIKGGKKNPATTWYSVDMSLLAGATYAIRGDGECAGVDSGSIAASLVHQSAMERSRTPFSSVDIIASDEAESSSPARARPVEIATFYAAFASREKPFFKVCQAASYLHDWIAMTSDDMSRATFHALALTNCGIEGVSDNYAEGDEWAQSNIMQSLGQVYREIIHGDSADFQARKMELFLAAYRKVASVLPRELLPPEGFADNFNDRYYRSFCGSEVFKSCDELTPEMVELSKKSPVRSGFVNPGMLLSDPMFLQTAADYPERFAASAEFTPAINGVKLPPTLRSLHSAGISAHFSNYNPDDPTLLLLLGHPGIGKTTSTIEWIRNNSKRKTLLVYSSPRISINESLSDKLLNMSGFCLLSTNSTILEIGRKCSSNHDIASAIGFDSKKELNKALIGTAYSNDMSHHEETSATDTCFFRNVHKIGEAYSKNPDIFGRNDAFIDQVSADIAIQRPRNRDNTVLESLLGAGKELVPSLVQDTNFRGLILTFAMQAYREMNFVDLLRDSLAKFGEHFEDIILFFDEVTGTEHGWSLSNDVISLCGEAGQIAPNCRVMTVIADASLVNQSVFKEWITADADRFPACLLRDVSCRSSVVPYSENISFLGKEYESIKVKALEANAYPAKNLIVQYNLGIQEVFAEKDIQAAAAENVKKRVAALVAQELGRERDDSRKPQVLVFLQNKDLLEDIKGELSRIPRAAKAVVLTADVPPDKKRKIMESTCGEEFSTDAVLVTSTASRGIDFPNVTTTICVANRFAPESTLMEIQQALFRSRGGGKDDLNRKVIFVIEDACLFPGEADRDAYWKKRMFDLASLVLMLRSTLLTRSTGRSGLSETEFDYIFAPIGSATIRKKPTNSVTVLNDIVTMLGAIRRHANDDEDGTQSIASLSLAAIHDCIDQSNLMFTNVASLVPNFDIWVSPYYTGRQSEVEQSFLEKGVLFDDLISCDEAQVSIREMPPEFVANGNTLMCNVAKDHNRDMWLKLMYANEKVAQTLDYLKDLLLGIKSMLKSDQVPDVSYPKKVSYLKLITLFVSMLDLEKAENSEGRNSSSAIITQRCDLSFIFPISYLNNYPPQKGGASRMLGPLFSLSQWEQQCSFPGLRQDIFTAEYPWIVTTTKLGQMKKFNALRIGREFNLFLRLL